MYQKSPTCVGRASGRPLNEYGSREEATEHARYLTKTRRGPKMSPYACESCGRWHLSPTNRQTRSETCGLCRGSDGVPKERYHTEQEAQRRAQILRKEQRVSLTVYRCPMGEGWHLTKGAGR